MIKINLYLEKKIKAHGVHKRMDTISERKDLLGVDRIKNTKVSNIKNSDLFTDKLKAAEPVMLRDKKSWINKETRIACKYTPVMVLKEQNSEAKVAMDIIQENRMNCVAS